MGFYGGIDYGFGYFGVGFVGGRWDNGHFFYNRSVVNIDVNVIHNVYNSPVITMQSRQLQRRESGDCASYADKRRRLQEKETLPPVSRSNGTCQERANQS